MKVNVNAVQTVVRDVNVEVNPKSAVYDIKKELFSELEKSIDVQSLGVKSHQTVSSFSRKEQQVLMVVCNNNGSSYGGHYDSDDTYYEIDITEVVECLQGKKRFYLLLDSYLSSKDLYNTLWDLEILDMNN